LDDDAGQPAVEVFLAGTRPPMGVRSWHLTQMLADFPARDSVPACCG
jgi:hypothetical protein